MLEFGQINLLSQILFRSELALKGRQATEEMFGGGDANNISCSSLSL